MAGRSCWGPADILSEYLPICVLGPRLRGDDGCGEVVRFSPASFPRRREPRPPLRAGSPEAQAQPRRKLAPAGATCGAECRSREHCSGRPWGHPQRRAPGQRRCRPGVNPGHLSTQIAGSSSATTPQARPRPGATCGAECRSREHCSGRPWGHPQRRSAWTEALQPSPPHRWLAASPMRRTCAARGKGATPSMLPRLALMPLAESFCRALPMVPTHDLPIRHTAQ